MIKVDIKNMPESPISKTEKSDYQSLWYNDVRYEIWDKRNDSPLDAEQYVCYSSITRNLINILNKMSGEERKELFVNGFTRYFCKNGDNSRRVKYMLYIIGFFEPLYKKIHLYWSEDAKQIIVDAYWKTTTPLDSIYALGSFLRISWEQWHFWEADETSEFELLMQGSKSDYTGHIPTLFVTQYGCQFKGKQKAEAGRVATEILLDMIKAKQVYVKTFSSLKFPVNKIDHSHAIQRTAYYAVTNSDRFKAYNFDFGALEAEDW